MKTIKFSLIYLIAIFAVGMVSSCSKDDDNDKGNNSLIGTWKMIKDNPGEDKWGIGGDDLFSEVTFKKDNVFIRPVHHEDGYEDDVYIDKYYVDGNILRIDFNIDNGVVDDFSYGTYSISGDELTYNFMFYGDPDDEPSLSDNKPKNTIVLKRVR